jgi:hypothetical protein
LFEIIAIDNLKKMFDDKNIRKALYKYNLERILRGDYIEARALMINKKQKE